MCALSLSLAAEKEEGVLTVCVYVLCESYMQVPLNTAPCPWHSTCLALSASFVCFWDTCSDLLLVELEDRQVAAASPQPR